MWPTLVECISLMLLFAHTNGRLRLRKNLERCILRSKSNESQFVLAVFIRYIISFPALFPVGHAKYAEHSIIVAFNFGGQSNHATSSVLKSHTSTVLFPKPLFVLSLQNKQALNVLYIAWFTDPLMRDGEEQIQGLIIYSIATIAQS